MQTVAPWRSLAVFLLAPTAIALVTAQFVFLSRAPINLDYLLIGALFVWLRPWQWGALLVVVILLDVTVVVAQAYYFEPSALMTSAGLLSELDPLFVAFNSLAVLALTLALCWLATRYLLRSRSSRLATSLLFLGLTTTTVVADGFMTGNGLIRRDTAMLPFNLATSGAWDVVRSFRHQGTAQQAGRPPLPAMAASDVIRQALGSKQALPRNIVLVLSESWGRLVDPAIEQQVRNMITVPGLSERYHIEWGQVPFLGSTVPGELRELCGVRSQVVTPRAAYVSALHCLPKRLAERGFETRSVHGFTGTFFNRTAWYPALGFEHIGFAQDIERQQPGLPRCGTAFRGYCDADVFAAASRTLIGAARPQFLYWLSLNAHTPVEQPPLATADCKGEEAVCRLAGFYSIVLRAVTQAALMPELQDTAFIVVGDHAPPALRKETRDAFEHAEVPYVVLWPRHREFPHTGASRR